MAKSGQAAVDCLLDLLTVVNLVVPRPSYAADSQLMQIASVGGRYSFNPPFSCWLCTKV